MKLLFENWRKFLDEDVDDTRPLSGDDTAPRAQSPFFGDRKPIDQEAEAKKANDIIIEKLESIGLQVVRFLGSGFYNKVYEVELPLGNRRFVAKVTKHQQEMPNYQWMMNQHEKFPPDVQKHFPVIYNIRQIADVPVGVPMGSRPTPNRADWTDPDPEGAMNVIIMELLKPAPPEVAQDLFYAGKGRFDLPDDPAERKRLRDRRESRFFSTEDSVREITEYCLESDILKNLRDIPLKIPTKEELTKEVVASWYRDANPEPPEPYIDPDDALFWSTSEAGSAVEAQRLVNIMCDVCFKYINIEGFKYVIVEEIVKKMQTKLEQNIVPLSMGYALPGGEESAGEGVKTAYPEVQSLMYALNYVAKKGLVGGDLHDENVMARPRTDELVIADLGNFKLKAEQQSLQEAMPQERSHIKAALQLAPEELAFNDLFDGKKRLVYDFPIADKTTEAGKFIRFWAEMGYKVDWDKGVISGEKTNPSDESDYAVDAILADAGLMATRTELKTRTIKMKIGKWFSKVQGYVDKILKMDKEVEEKTGKSMLRRISMKEIENALGEKKAKEFNRNVDMLNMLATEDVGIRFLKNPGEIKKLAKYWTDKAGFLKKNIDDLLTGLKGYAIVITRDPMDVFRMGDFMEIYDSCHRPQSKVHLSTHETGQYYPCAVAEAHGHGAVAYVVDKQELLNVVGASSIEEVEGAIQTGELFYDADMPEFMTGELLPIQRIRLRQVRYWEEGEMPSKLASKINLSTLDTLSDERGAEIIRHARAGVEGTAGTELAVPETSKNVYAKDDVSIPEFETWLLNWARENQAEMLQKAPRAPEKPDIKHGDEPWQWGTIDLVQFVKFGGTYEDTSIKNLILRLFGSKMKGVGMPLKDKTTEDNLDLEIVDTRLESWQVECNQIANKWNNDYADCVVEANVSDDEGGGIVIKIKAEMWVSWPLDEWKKLPNPIDGQYAADDLRDLGFSWIAQEGGLITRREEKVMLRIEINPQGVLGFDQASASDPENFESFCAKLNKIDNTRYEVKTWLERYFLREGDLKGSTLQQWGMEIVNEDFETPLPEGPWAIKAEKGGDWEIESVTASFFPVIQLGDVSREVGEKVLESWEFWTRIRKFLVAQAQEKLVTRYYPDSEHSIILRGDTQMETQFSFVADVDDPDEQVEVMKAAIESWDDEDELTEMVNNTFQHLAAVSTAGHDIKEEQQLLRVAKLLKMV